MKKIFSFLITLTFILSIFVQVVQADTLDINQSHNNSYISLIDAKLLALDTLSSRHKNDSSCPWKNGIKISDIVTLYDFDDTPNAYAFNLKQDNKDSGYILVSANANAPEVEGFSYDERFYSDKIVDQNHKGNKLYYFSNYNLFVKSVDSGNQAFYNAFSNNKIAVNKNTIKSDYTRFLKSKNNTKSKSLLDKLKTNSSLKSVSISNSINNLDTMNYSQVVYEKHDVPGFDQANFYVAGDQAGCAPNAGTTIVHYWYQQRGVYGLQPIGVDNYQRIYSNLYGYMKTNATTGTTSQNAYQGLNTYAMFNKAASGCNYTSGSNTTFNLIQTNIASTVPVMLDLWTPTYSVGHVVAVFGTEYNSDDQWLRIADGFSSSHGTWMRYSQGYAGYTNVSSTYYVRWN